MFREILALLAASLYWYPFGQVSKVGAFVLSCYYIYEGIKRQPLAFVPFGFGLVFALAMSLENTGHPLGWYRPYGTPVFLIILWTLSSMATEAVQDWLVRTALAMLRAALAACKYVFVTIPVAVVKRLFRIVVVRTVKGAMDYIIVPYVVSPVVNGVRHRIIPAVKAAWNGESNADQAPASMVEAGGAEANVDEAMVVVLAAVGAAANVNPAALRNVPLPSFRSTGNGYNVPNMALPSRVELPFNYSDNNEFHRGPRQFSFPVAALPVSINYAYAAPAADLPSDGEARTGISNREGEDRAPVNMSTFHPAIFALPESGKSFTADTKFDKDGNAVMHAAGSDATPIFHPVAKDDDGKNDEDNSRKRKARPAAKSVKATVAAGKHNTARGASKKKDEAVKPENDDDDVTNEPPTKRRRLSTNQHQDLLTVPVLESSSSHDLSLEDAGPLAKQMYEVQTQRGEPASSQPAPKTPAKKALSGSTKVAAPKKAAKAAVKAPKPSKKQAPAPKQAPALKRAMGAAVEEEDERKAPSQKQIARSSRRN